MFLKSFWMRRIRIQTLNSTTCVAHKMLTWDSIGVCWHCMNMIKLFLILKNCGLWKDKIRSLNLFRLGSYILLNGNLTTSYLEKILQMTTIEWKINSTNAHVPKRAYQGLTGYDLWAEENKFFKPCGRALTRLDLYMTIPEGYYG